MRSVAIEFHHPHSDYGLVRYMSTYLKISFNLFVSASVSYTQREHITLNKHDRLNRKKDHPYLNSLLIHLLTWIALINWFVRNKNKQTQKKITDSQRLSRNINLNTLKLTDRYAIELLSMFSEKKERCNWIVFGKLIY